MWFNKNEAADIYRQSQYVASTFNATTKLLKIWIFASCAELLFQSRGCWISYCFIANQSNKVTTFFTIVGIIHKSHSHQQH